MDTFYQGDGDSSTICLEMFANLFHYSVMDGKISYSSKSGILSLAENTLQEARCMFL